MKEKASLKWERRGAHHHASFAAQLSKAERANRKRERNEKKKKARNKRARKRKGNTRTEEAQSWHDTFARLSSSNNTLSSTTRRP